jgi:hypothetical protein
LNFFIDVWVARENRHFDLKRNVLWGEPLPFRGEPRPGCRGTPCVCPNQQANWPPETCPPTIPVGIISTIARSSPGIVPRQLPRARRIRTERLRGQNGRTDSGFTGRLNSPSPRPSPPRRGRIVGCLVADRAVLVFEHISLRITNERRLPGEHPNPQTARIPPPSPSGRGPG